jgi:hypothetical protein
MGWATRLRPRRDLIVPMLAIASPAVWFVLRELTTGLRFEAVTAASLGRYGVLTGGALLGSYLVAALVVARVRTRAWTDHPLAAVVLAPSTATLAVLGFLLGGVVVYFLGPDVVPIPEPIDRLAVPIGLVMALPLLVSMILTYALMDGTGPLRWVGTALFSVGVSLSVLWTTVLAGAITNLVAAPSTQ